MVSLVTWDEAQMTAVAVGMQRYLALSHGDRAARAQAEEHWWAIDAVIDDALDGSIPIEAIDVMLHHPDADDEFRGYVAAGPIEDVLAQHPAEYGPAIAARCREDSTWADAVTGVWLDDQEWSALPEELRQLIPVHSISPDSTHAKKPRGKRPSKRQGKRPRHS